MGEFNLDRQIKNIVERKTLHALIDAVPDDKIAILCAIDAEGATCWAALGDPRFRETMGLLEAVKARIAFNNFADDDAS